MDSLLQHGAVHDFIRELEHDAVEFFRVLNHGCMTAAVDNVQASFRNPIPELVGHVGWGYPIIPSPHEQSRLCHLMQTIGQGLLLCRPCHLNQSSDATPILQ